METRTHDLLRLLTGAVKPLGKRGAPSGIEKSAVSGPRALTLTGFEGDAQGDLAHHGGPEKAVHHYPIEHYAAWKAAIGAHPLLERPGAFGENLSTLGLTEDNVAIGDVFEVGTAVLEVSQGRQPCWKLNERFGRADMARLVQSSGRTGWYYRVLKPGIVGPSDGLRLVSSHSPEWTLRRIWRAFYVDMDDRDDLARIAEHPKLTDGWRALALRRLRSGRVEDWTKRLTGETPAP